MIYTTTAIFALIIIGCGSDGDNQAIEIPGEYIVPSDTMPQFWGDVDCDSNYTITSSGVIVHSTSAGFVWPGLVQNGELRKWGPGKWVDAGATFIPALQIYLRRNEIPEGNYEFIVYLAEDTSGIGVMSARKTEVLVDHYSLSYPDSAIVCIDAVLGDSLYFHVDYEWDTYVITLSDAPPGDYQGAKWWALRGRVRDSLVEDTLWLAKLDTNGLFFPLKVTNPDSGYTWTIRAVNRYNMEDTAEAEVRVSRPTRLGYYNNAYDTIIAWWASKQGVPVSLLKALVHKESGQRFDTAAYRYEPLYDYVYLSRIGINLLHSAPYNQYNKQIPNSSWPLGPLARGSDLNWHDTVPAVDRYGNDVEDLNSDGYLSGREYLCTVTGQNWGSCDTIPVSADFIAQTTLASSYGLAQIMWPTAYRPMRWEGEQGGHRNPYLLFSREINLKIGAGYLRRLFAESDSLSWMGRWRDALLQYNGGNDPEYDDDVLDLVNQYPPIKE